MLDEWLPGPGTKTPGTLGKGDDESRRSGSPRSIMISPQQLQHIVFHFVLFALFPGDLPSARSLKIYTGRVRKRVPETGHLRLLRPQLGPEPRWSMSTLPC